MIVATLGRALRCVCSISQGLLSAIVAPKPDSVKCRACPKPRKVTHKP